MAPGILDGIGQAAALALGAAPALLATLATLAAVLWFQIFGGYNRNLVTGMVLLYGGGLSGLLWAAFALWAWLG